LLVLGLSLLRRRNLAVTMWTGRVVGAGPDLIRKERRRWALVLAAVVLVSTWALWQQERLNAPAASSHREHRHHGEDDD
jgi:hypothetical protein